MGSNSSVAVTPSGSTLMKCFQEAGGTYVQYAREVRATAVTLNSWTITTAGQASQVAADVNRTGMLMVNGGTGIVYIRFDSTIPTTTAYHWYLDPADRWEVPDQFVQLAVSLDGATAGGVFLTTLGTAS